VFLIYGFSCSDTLGKPCEQPVVKAAAAAEACKSFS